MICGAQRATLNQRVRLHGRAAFTLIEIMVVIAVIALLFTIAVFVGSAVMQQQRVSATRTTMQLLESAAEDFATANPLRNSGYDWIGPYPPYPVDAPNHGDLNAGDFPPGGFGDLVVQVFTGQRNPRVTTSDYVNYQPADPTATGEDPELLRWHSVLSLYATSQAFAPSAVANIPQDKLAAPPLADPLLVNPEGNGTDPGDEGAFDVLGAVDAWGVPIEYLLYIKIEPQMNASGETVWAVTDRMPVFLSRGTRAEEIDGGNLKFNFTTDPANWIWSQELPTPRAAVERDGELAPPSGNHAGWLRLKSAGADYGFLPKFDPAP